MAERGRLGILGGSFNPPHLGHLLCAQEAAVRLRLDRVLLMPVNAPPHKPMPVEPGVGERVELCRLAVVGDPRLGVSTLEAERPGPSYTVETLRLLRERGESAELVWLLGADMAATLACWRKPAEIVRLARLGVAARDGVGEAQLREHLREVPGAEDAVEFFAMPRIDVSSSAVRSRVAEDLPIRYLVPDAVASRIARRGLYR